MVDDGDHACSMRLWTGIIDVFCHVYDDCFILECGVY